jgi:transposase InsO family protein
MDLKLHANATTTPKTRAYIQNSKAPASELAAELGVSESTVRRWRKRTGVTDRSHRPLRLAALSLTPLEEQLIVELRTEAGLALDDIVAVMRRCVNATLSRSAIHRCLQRHAISRRTAPPGEPHQRFEPASFGYVHVDLKHLPRLEARPAYVFVAIERMTRFVHVEIVTSRDGETIAACLERFLESFGHPVHTILTDNGAEFTDRFRDARWNKTARKPSGRHPFDRLCARHGIAHKLTRPLRPQTNGMAERFNRRLAQALRQAPPTQTNQGKNRFLTHAQRNRFIERFANAYNHTRLKALGYSAPINALDNQAGHNTKAGTSVCDAILKNRGPLSSRHKCNTC